MRKFKATHKTLRENPKLDFIFNLILLYSGQAIRFAGSFIITAILYRKYGLTSLGSYAVLISVFSLLTSLMGWSISAFSVSLTISDVIKEESIIRIWYLYAFISVVIVSIFGIANHVRAWHLLMFLLAIYMSMTSSPYLSIVLHRKSQSEKSLILFTESFTYTVSSIILILKTNFVDAVLISLIISTFSRRLLSQLFARKFRIFQILVAPAKTYIEDFKALGKHINFGLNGILNVINLQSNNILIKLISGDRAVGIYNVYWRIPNAISQLLWRIGESIFIYVSRAYSQNDGKAISRYVRKTETLSLVASSATALLYVLLANKLAEIWLGKGAFIPHRIAIITSILIITTSLRRVYSSALYGMGKLSFTNIIILMDILAKAIAVLLWPYFGTFGFFAAWLISSFTGAVVLKVVLQKEISRILQSTSLKEQEV